MWNESINQCWVIRREFESIGPTLFKNCLGAGWGLLPALRWVGSWLLICLTKFLLSSSEKISQQGSNHQLLHYHPVV